MQNLRPIQFAFSIFCALACTQAYAQAQYIWLNEKGVKQYSDTPPPRTVPADRILKKPGFKTARPLVQGEAKEESQTVNDISKIEKPMTLAKKNEEFMKRKIAKEEAEKKAETEQFNKDVRAKNCERAKNYKQSLDEGVLIMSRDKNGERTVLDEAQRNKELQEVKRVLDECRQ